MGRPKKKMSFAAPSQVKEGSQGENPPVPRKRGRPRKIVQEAAKVEEPLNADAKKPKTSGEAAGMSSAQKRQTDATEVALAENSDLSTASLIEEPGKAKIAKREGSRRKSEPRRAAESLFAGM